MIGREPEGYKTLASMSQQQVETALENSEALLARRPEWKAGEAVIRMLLRELSRRHQESEEAA